jgi:AGCS family alanine or glycine:cation symporter
VLIFTDFDAGGPNGENGSQLTSLAFESVFPWFSWVLMGAILLFAFSTMISWSYYGLKAWEYLFGGSKVAEYSYKLLFLVFIVVGASAERGAVMDFSDLMILGMAFPNIIGLIILLPEVRKDLNDFIQSVKSGKIHNHD